MIPKSTNRDRISGNFDLFDFNLSDAEMAKMDKLDRGSAGRTFDMDFLELDISNVNDIPGYPWRAGGRDDY